MRARLIRWVLFRYRGIVITRRRKPIWPAVVLGALALSGCGSNGEDTVAEPPRIPAAKGTQLAELSERIAGDLDAGDECSAAESADDLLNAIERAHLDKRFSDAKTVATSLAERIDCPPPPAPTNAEEEQDDGPGNGNGGGQGRGVGRGHAQGRED